MHVQIHSTFVCDAEEGFQGLWMLGIAKCSLNTKNEIHPLQNMKVLKDLRYKQRFDFCLG